MSYPDRDTPLIESAIAAHQTLNDAIAQTDTNIHNLTIAQRACTAERSRLIDLAARGEAVPAGTSAEMRPQSAATKLSCCGSKKFLPGRKV